MTALTQHSYELRDYQLDLIKEVYALIRSGIQRILVYAPTGAGKTMIACQIQKDAVSRGRRVLFLVHRDTLVYQTLETLRKFGLDAGVIKTGFRSERSHLIQIASIQTLARRAIPPADLIVADECHTLSYFAGFDRLLKTMPDAKLLGFTATPWRLKKDEGLRSIYQKLVCAPQVAELIQMGFLVPPRYFGYGDIDLSQIGTTVAGEFNAAELSVVCNTPAILARMIAEYKRLALGRRAIAFAITVKHSSEIAKAFNEAGISAEHLDCSTSSDERQAIFTRVRRGETLLLSSVGVLTEGFDIPEISCVVLGRPTKSKALNLQMVGRGLRIAPWDGKLDCIILDFAENSKRHGFCTDRQQISLEEPEEIEFCEAPPIKACPECGALVHLSVMLCPECGYEFLSAKVEIERDEMLIDLKSEVEAKIEAKKYEFYQRGMRLAFHNRYAPGWASLRFWEKFGVWPPQVWQKGIVFGDAPTEADRKAYYYYLCHLASRIGRSERWIAQQMELEFGSA